MAWTLLLSPRAPGEIGCSEFMHSNLIKLFQPRLRKNSPSAVQSRLRKGGARRNSVFNKKQSGPEIYFPRLRPELSFSLGVGNADWYRAIQNCQWRQRASFIFAHAHALSFHVKWMHSVLTDANDFSARARQAAPQEKEFPKKTPRRRRAFYFWPTTNCSNKFSFIVPAHWFILRPIQNWSKWVRKCVFTHTLASINMKCERVILEARTAAAELHFESTWLARGHPKSTLITKAVQMGNSRKGSKS